MHVLIFEGIATSGKSTITDYINKSLRDRMVVKVISEELTHEPIKDLPQAIHRTFFEDLVNTLSFQQVDIILIDRLYITQAQRSHSNLSEYSSVEEALLPYSPHTILLKVDEVSIAPRIKETSQKRGPQWQAYIETKGPNYYINQQRDLLALMEQSKLPYMVLDTTACNYGTVADDILKLIIS